MKASEIRRRFLDYFVSKGHDEVASAPLIPRNDPTLFFVNAGMVQFKDVFIGAEHRDNSRATSVQKCLRVSGKHNDLENVGHTPRHHTLFEMLGNFSFGDYFKQEAIEMAWEVVTDVFGIDSDRLWVTVYEEDDEAYALWKQIGVREHRIQRLGAKDNFWSMGPTGPCGPCSEIFYDHGPEISDDERGPAGEDDRYVEIWNLVFMQYEQHADGTRTDLPRPSIDTGSGLERVAAVLQGVYNNYDTDLFHDIIGTAARIAGVTYGRDPEIDTALRVIADHSRATAFLIGDGVIPSNTSRGYVLRRIMRRAIRYAVKLNIDTAFMHETVDAVLRTMEDGYPELTSRRTFILDAVKREEALFRRTLQKGLQLLTQHFAELDAGGTLDGAIAFRMYDTFGFPLDLTQLIAEEQGFIVDVVGFNSAMEEAKKRSRDNWKGSGEQAIGALWHELTNKLGPTQFVGYDRATDSATVVALVREHKSEDGTVTAEEVDTLNSGEAGVVLLDQTPLYGESGGQVGDAGTLDGFTVHDTAKAAGLHLHRGVATGSVSVGQTLTATAESGRRDDTKRNHTATHLLHAALRNILGDHVTQKGSLVAPNRLRFDFSHPGPMTPDELLAVERQVNDEILANKSLTTTVESMDDAVARGAMALFGEKYDDVVRVVSIPGYSVELCGGTHCSATGDIGLFRITSEGGVASGVRRIEAQTGYGAHAVIQAERAQLDQASASLKTKRTNVVDALTRLQSEKRTLEKELAALQRELAKMAAGDLIGQARTFDGVKVLAASFDGDLKEQADRLRDQLGSALVVLFSEQNGRVRIVAAATKDIAGKRIKAGDVIKAVGPLVGGKGGGRPDMAQGGGTDPSGIPAAIDQVYTFAESVLG